MSYRSRRKWCRLICVIIPVVMMMILLHVMLYSLNVKDPIITHDAFLQLSTCPACYGKDLCPLIQHPDGPKIRLEENRTLLQRMSNVKNVFPATMYDGRKIMLKKLAQDSELRLLDQVLCDVIAARPDHRDCDLSETWHRISSLGDVHRVLVAGRNAMALRGVTLDAIQCPSERFLSALLGNVSDPEFVNKWPTVLTALLVNPEPLLLKMFNTFSPFFPELIGACGRVVAVTHAGASLDTYLSHPLLTRLRIVRQLLLLARQLATDNPFGLSFYLTDVSYDNFAVTVTGTGTSERPLMRMVDVEGVVVVDTSGMPAADPSPDSDWSNNDLASGGFRFSFDDLCSRDSAASACHNYRAICQCLLSDVPCSPIDVPVGGLLWGIPIDLETRWRIKQNIKSCSLKPPGRCTKACQNLFRIVDEMINYLRPFRTLPEGVVA